MSQASRQAAVEYLQEHADEPLPGTPVDFVALWGGRLDQQHPADRGLHVAGTTVGLASAAYALAPLLTGGRVRWQYLVAGPLVGFGLALAGRFLAKTPRHARSARRWSTPGGSSSRMPASSRPSVERRVAVVGG